MVSYQEYQMEWPPNLSNIVKSHTHILLLAVINLAARPINFLLLYTTPSDTVDILSVIDTQ
jgi:hypothetical protein